VGTDGGSAKDTREAGLDGLLSSGSRLVGHPPSGRAPPPPLRPLLQMVQAETELAATEERIVWPEGAVTYRQQWIPELGREG
jgi:hypothetical protein